MDYQCRTDIDEAKVISARQHKSKFNFELFEQKIFNFWVLIFSTREDLPIDVSISYQCRTDIDESKMISALCLLVCQNRHKSKFEFRTFLKKIKIFEFSWCSTSENLSIDVAINY